MVLRRLTALRNHANDLYVLCEAALVRLEPKMATSTKAWFAPLLELRPSSHNSHCHHNHRTMCRTDCSRDSQEMKAQRRLTKHAKGLTTKLCLQHCVAARRPIGQPLSDSNAKEHGGLLRPTGWLGIFRPQPDSEKCGLPGRDFAKNYCPGFCEKR